MKYHRLPWPFRRRRRTHPGVLLVVRALDGRPLLTATSDDLYRAARWNAGGPLLQLATASGDVIELACSPVELDDAGAIRDWPPPLSSTQPVTPPR